MNDKENTKIDSLGLTLMFSELRMPAIKNTWEQFAERADREGWPAGRLLWALAELELAERGRRRIQRHLNEAHLIAAKSLDNFDFSVVPTISPSRVRALASNDSWLKGGHNVIIFGPPGAGKSHLASAIGLALVEQGKRVMFTRTTDLVQRLQMAHRELRLESVLEKLNRYDLLILDDLAYVRKDRDETRVLFELISNRYESRSLLITANQPFEEWKNVFPDENTAVAAVDRLVHHCVILEMNVESYRLRHAMGKRKEKVKKKRGRPAKYATGNNSKGLTSKTGD